MLRTIGSSLAVLFALALPLSAQGFDFDAAVKELREAQKKGLDSDQMHFAKELAGAFEKLDDKQKDQAQKALAGNLRSKNQQVLEATVDALAKMGGGPKERFSASATKILSDETKKPTTEDNVAYFVVVLDGIGRLKHPSGIPTLEKLMKYKDYDVVGGSMRALGHYEAADIEVKRPVVEEMLKIYTGLANAARDTRDTSNNAQTRLGKVQGSAESSLKRLTGQKLEGADAWWKWWNDSGKKAASWPKAEG